MCRIQEALLFFCTMEALEGGPGPGCGPSPPTHHPPPPTPPPPPPPRCPLGTAGFSKVKATGFQLGFHCVLFEAPSWNMKLALLKEPRRKQKLRK